MVAQQSLKNLYEEHLKSYAFFLTYRLSQDHIELLFNCIRRRGGWNNNPSAVQLRGTFRSILLGAGCRSANFGNVLPLDDTPPAAYEPEEDGILEEMLPLTEYVEDVVEYIGGWVIRKAMSRIGCFTCIGCLEQPNPSRATSLISLKDYGHALKCPSHDLMSLLLLCESLLRQSLPFTRILSNVLRRYGKMGSLFHEAEHHFADMTHGVSSHYYSLVKFCAETYLNLRMHHMARLENDEHRRQSKRQLFNKLTLFAHQ